MRRRSSGFRRAALEFRKRADSTWRRRFGEALVKDGHNPIAVDLGAVVKIRNTYYIDGFPLFCAPPDSIEAHIDDLDKIYQSSGLKALIEESLART